MELAIVVAAAKNHVIGENNQLIWHLPADLQHFKQITIGHPIVMGRKTYESIGRPLPNRTNIIITRDLNYHADGCIIVHSINEALEQLKDSEKAFIIGGGTIYKEMWNRVDKIYFTEVDLECSGDTYVPAIDSTIWEETEREEHLADEKNKLNYSFITYSKKG